MKLSVDRRELTGLFGGKYYETSVRLVMLDDEKDTARKQRLMNYFVLGAKSPEDAEAKFSFWMTQKWGITVEDLAGGVTGKASNESELHNLAKFENLIRERCKALKERLDNAISAQQVFSNGNSSFEEEF